MSYFHIFSQFSQEVNHFFLNGDFGAPFGRRRWQLPPPPPLPPHYATALGSIFKGLSCVLKKKKFMDENDPLSE